MEEINTTRVSSSFDEICQIIDNLAADNLNVQSETDDEESKLFGIKQKLKVLSDNLSIQKNDRFRIEESMVELLDVVMAMSSMDFSKRANVYGQDYIFDAIALGLNGVMDVLAASAKSMRYNDNMLKALTDMIVICNAEGTILAINEAVTAALGYRESELTGMSLSMLLDEDANEAFGISAIVEHNSLDGIETTFLNKDQKSVYVSMSTSTLKNEEGEVERIVCVVRETTEQRLMDEALNSSNKRLAKRVEEYKGIMESISDAIIKRDDNGDVLFVSPSIESVTGYTAEEWKENYRDYLTNSTDNRLFLNKPRRKQSEYEIELIRKDGSSIWLEVKETAEFDGKKLLHRIAVARDITESRHRSVESEQAQQFFKSIIDNFPYLISIKNAEDLTYIQINRQGEELLGFKREEIISKNDYQLFREEEAERSVAADNQTIKSGKPVQIDEDTIETAHKGARSFRTNKVLIANETGSDYLLTVSQDITELKLVEEIAHRDRDDALQANALNLAMINDLIVILQTSLKSSVVDCDNLWKHSLFRLPKQDIQTLNRLSANDRRAIDILKDAAELVEIESGDIALNIKPVRLDDIVSDATDYMRTAAKDKGIVLNSDIPEEIDEIDTDGDKLLWILLALLDNAVTYTDEGGITVRLVTGGSGAAPIRIEVEDSGIGISFEELSSIFAPLYRGSNRQTMSRGVGFGLTSAKALCHALGCRLRVSSEVGKGSLFTISLQDR